MARVQRRAAQAPDPATHAGLLMGWFAKSARDLPWRHTLDPYAIWVSEVMLQQTQVKTVIPYWTRWMADLPDVQRLAEAPTEAVLKLWEGLGYYRRARHLQQAARRVVEEAGGRLPVDLREWQALPGIGRYTAGAITSIAFNQPSPILDGNVIRVFCRLLASTEDPGGTALRATLWSMAQDWVLAAQGMAVPEGLPQAPGVRFSGPCSVLNQALMELGATVCTPTHPACPECPLSRHCLARKTGKPGDFPRPSERPTIIQRTLATVLWEQSGRWLVRRRPEGSVNGGLWEFPAIECRPEDDPCGLLAGWLGVDASRLLSAGTIRHSITRYRFQQRLFRLSAGPGQAMPPPEGEWKSREELDALAWTAAHRRALHLLDG